MIINAIIIAEIVFPQHLTCCSAQH